MNKTQNLFKISLSALFVAVIAISALITVPAPVPFTLQTLGIFVACFFLGFKWSLFSVSAYLLIGAVGLPVFAGFQGGFAALFGPTGGFIIGFLFIPLLNGILSLIFPKKFAPLYLLLGLLCCYLLGSLWFTVYSGKTSFFAVFLSTFAAYIVPDVIKLVLAKKIAKLLNRATAKLGLFGNDILSPVKIKSAIQNKVELFVFDTVDSTNTAAAKAIKNGVALPALFVAQNQTHGRGRRGRSFYSNGGLYMTLALPTNAENNLSVTTLCSVAVAEAIEELTGQKVGIKWVNDIYLKNKKVAGILCENVKDNQTNAALGTIVGVGVNLNVKEFPKNLKNIATSINSAEISKNTLAAKIANNIFLELNKSESYIPRYKKRSVVLGKQISFEQNGQTKQGFVKDIAENGALLVNVGGETVCLDSGEITIRLKK